MPNLLDSIQENTSNYISSVSIDGNEIVITKGDGTTVKQTKGSNYINISSTTITFESDLNIEGNLSKASGSFKIHHPLPEKTDTHYLVHSFTESPKADLIYSGMATLGDNGKRTINIDDVAGMTQGTFEILTCNLRRFTSNQSGFIPVKSILNKNELTIIAPESECRDEIFSIVIGERCDPYMKQTSWTDKDGHVVVEHEK